MSEVSTYNQRRDSVPMLTTVAEYQGQESVRIAATQLGMAYSATAAKRVVSDWVDFFASGPSPIRELHFVSRTPRRLFEALASQTQLERLQVKWGDYEDLNVLVDLHALRELVLLGASSVRTLQPLAGHTQVLRLEIESLKLAHDLSPIAAMSSVTELDLGGNWMSLRTAHVDSIGFLDRMPQLREVVLHTIVVDDRDYSPLLRLPNLVRTRVQAAGGMKPSIEELRTALPFED